MLHDASWTINPPGTADHEALRGWLHDKLHDWRRRRDNLQFGNNGSSNAMNAQTPVSADNSPVHNEEAMYYEHLSKAHNKWGGLSAQAREEQWHYECAKAYAREQERHQATTLSLQHAEQEIKILRNQIAQMSSNILPPEFIQFPPAALPFTSETISHLPDPKAPLYDSDAFIAKWKSRIRSARSTQMPLPTVSLPPSHQPTNNTNTNGNNRFEFLQRAAAQEAQGISREPDDDEDVRGDLEDAPGEEEDDDNDNAYDQQQQRKAVDSHPRAREGMAQPQLRGSRRLVGLGADFRSDGTTDVEMEGI